MYSKKKDQRGFQKPVFFCTQNLKEIVDDDFKQALGDKLLSGLKQKGLKAKVQSELLYSSTVSKSLLPRRNPPVKTTSSKSTADYCSSADFSIYHPDYRGWHHQNYSPSMSSYESISPSDSVGSFDHIYQDNSDSSGIFEEFRYPKLFFSPEELLEKVNKRKRMS